MKAFLIVRLITWATHTLLKTLPEPEQILAQQLIIKPKEDMVRDSLWLKL